MMGRAQISFEFILIFTLVLSALGLFIVTANSKLSDIDEQREYVIMRNLAENIENEVILANSVNNNYMRRFELPASINGKRYSLELIDQSILIINITEEGYAYREYTTYLPISVRGGFIDEINASSVEHCISKNDYDGIRIARNQAAIDLAEYDEGEDELSVYVSLNCVENIRSVRFTVSYDPTHLEFKEAEALTRADEPEENPLFEGMVGSPIDYEGAILPDTDMYYVDESVGRFTYSFISNSCATGSGNVAKLTFSVITDEEVETEISFDKDFNGLELVIFDCTANKNTVSGLPDSRQPANILLNPTS